MSWAPGVTPLAKVVRAISAKMSVLLALRAAIMRGGRGGQGIRGRGKVSWVWSISRAFAPCSVTVNVHVKLLEIINDASSCEAGMDEVRDEEFFRVSYDIQDAMSSAWKSSPKIEKRLRLDWTKTAQDQKFPGLSKTTTTVRSLVSHDFGNLKTNKRLV